MNTETMRRQIADIELRMPLTGDARRPFEEARARAQGVAECFADSAPSWTAGETLNQYRCRLLNRYRHHNATWKNIDVTALRGDSHHIERLLQDAETAIYADAVEAAKRPASYPDGTLKEIQTRDATGRVVSRFVGSAGACWDWFKPPVCRLVTGWRTRGPW